MSWPARWLGFAGLAPLAQSWGNDGRLASKRPFTTSSGTNLSLLSYAYDNDDNIVGISYSIDATRSIQYGYDSTGRLGQTFAASGEVKRFDFLYDKNGNRTRAGTHKQDSHWA